MVLSRDVASIDENCSVNECLHTEVQDRNFGLLDMKPLTDSEYLQLASDAEVKALQASGEFDENWYLNEYSDVEKSGIDPARHFLWIGRRLGRRPRAGAKIEAFSTTSSNESSRAIITDWNELPLQKTRANRWIQNTAAIARNQAQPLAPYTHSFNPESLNIHWVVPDFGPGGGGHMSIFRMVRYLESFGHKQTVWIQNPSIGKTPKELWENIRSWYQPIDKVIVRLLPEEVEGISGDLVIATDMWTAFPASQMTMMKERFYLIQDYEALFHIHGTFTYVAEMTYRMGFKAVCAGKWLKSLCENKFGMWTRSWDLAYDPLHYFAAKTIDHHETAMPRIAFYARATTPRRAVELGVEALHILHERGLAFQVDMFGQDELGADPEYLHVNHGLLTPSELGSLYRQCDLGLVFSATNYSLIPMEMMACGLPVVELDVDGTRAVFPDDAVAFAPPTPHAIADTLQRLLESSEERQKHREAGLRYIKSLNWENSARTLETALIEGLSEHNEPVRPRQLFATANYSHKAAVIVPTWNAGDAFRDVLQSLVTQKTDWAFDVLVVDSGSSDNTIAIVSEFSAQGVRLHQIPNSEFQHGRTRNLAISLTSAELVAVLTQDARPANDRWLANMVKAFSLGDEIAGAFGRHHVYPEASAFVRHGQDAHFDRLATLPQVAHWYVTPEGMEWGSLEHQQWLHFYSDNNSMMRRSVWEKIPYPEVHWAEDQLWAWEIAKQGYKKAYADDAVVFHSHNYSAEERYKISKIEGDLFLRFFNYRFEKTPAEIKASLDYMNAQSTNFAESQNLPNEILTEQIQLNKHHLIGRYDGQFNLLKNWSRRLLFN